MTQVDFYVLEDAAPRAAAVFACRLTEKVFGLGQRVFLHLSSMEAARELDQLMWSFRDRSFLPHCLSGEEPETAVHIGAGAEPQGDFHLLINLAAEVPPFFSRFPRVAEVVSGEAAAREAGRRRFRFYQERGYPLKTHKL